MIRFECPKCTAQYKVPEETAGRKTTCRKCKNPLRVPIEEIALPTAMPVDSSPKKRPVGTIACPGERCRSTQVVRAAAIYEQGTSRSTSLTGMIFNGAATGFFGGIGSTSGVSQTQLAARLAPPQLREYSGWAFLLLVLGIIFFFVGVIGAKNANSLGDGVLSILVFWGMATLFAINYFRNANSVTAWNIEQYPKLKEQWLAIWYCPKCGTTFLDK